MCTLVVRVTCSACGYTYGINAKAVAASPVPYAVYCSQCQRPFDWRKSRTVRAVVAEWRAAWARDGAA